MIYLDDPVSVSVIPVLSVHVLIGLPLFSKCCIDMLELRE